MISFNALYLKCRAYASDSNNDQFFKDEINNGQKIVENELDDFIVEDMRTGSTIAGLNQVPTPENYIRTQFFYVLNGTIRYDATPIFDEDTWQRLNQVTTISSNYLQFIFPRVDYAELYPVPSSILTYTWQYVSASHDMQYDDYSTGTITSIVNTVPTNALPYATVTGSGTTWTATMAGQFFKMAGDQQNYKITSVTDATHLVLAKAYKGIAISGFANTKYVIGEMPRIPEASHMLLYYYAMARYYEGPKKDATKAKDFDIKFQFWLKWATGTFSKRTNQGVIPSQRNLQRMGNRNPNLFPMTLNGGTG